MLTLRIDVHWHQVPAKLIEAIMDGKVEIVGKAERAGDEVKVELDNGFSYKLSASAKSSDPVQAIEHMDAIGLDVVAPSISPPLMHHNADLPTAVAISRTVNDGFAEMAEAHEGRFRPLANLPMQDAASAAEELTRAVRELGFPGAAISTHVNGRNLGEEDFRPFWRAVAELDAFIFLHPTPPSLGSKDRLNRHGMANFVGLPVDSAAALASLIFDGVYEDVGTIKTCFAHGGGAFPYIFGRWEHGYHARLEAKGHPTRNPNSYLDSVYADSLTHSDASLRLLVEVLGADHVCLGSDYPADMGVPDPVTAMERAIEDPGMREQVGGATASKLLGLTASAAR
jgi:aminocarboxymuconate-semialdehyde decarboxylase